MAELAGASGHDTPMVAVILGRCDDMRAEVFVRVAAPAAVGPLALVGRLTGPQCRRAITLPVTARLEDVSDPAAGIVVSAAAEARRQPALARAVLTEPSFWTPELPSLYRLEASVRCEGRDLAVIDRLVGLRRLGVRGRSFWLDGRRWVPRCVACELDGSEIMAVAAASATAFVVNPDDHGLAVADEVGTAVVAVLPESQTTAEAVARIADWSLHAGVVGVVLPATVTSHEAATIAAKVRALKGTLLMGWVVPGELPPVATPAGIDFFVVQLPADGLPAESWRTMPPVPLVAMRPAQAHGTSPADVATRRMACDRLQAELAGWGLAGGSQRQAWEWAGYAVT